nr:general transcription factor 3C polypeptide 5 [Oryctolagus cuniculus]
MAAGPTDARPGAAVALELKRERRMVCVEYPGVVRDVNKMLSTLGGEEGVSRSYTDPTKRLELYFRPKDPYCHPVCANRLSASSLLLRVRRRTRRPGAGAQPEITFDMEVVGIVPVVYKFQGEWRPPFGARCPSCPRQPRGPPAQARGSFRGSALSPQARRR